MICVMVVLLARQCLYLNADLTGQANHLAATIGANIIMQKQMQGNGVLGIFPRNRTHLAEIRASRGIPEGVTFS